MGLVDELEELPLAETGVGDDQLVDRLLGEDSRHGIERPKHWKGGLFRARRDDAEELVLDAAAMRAERLPQLREPLPLADEHGTPSCPGHAQDVTRHDVVARAQQ